MSIFEEDSNETADNDATEGPFDGEAPSGSAGLAEAVTGPTEGTESVSLGVAEVLETLGALPDAAWASYGEPDSDQFAESIIGSDDRVQITNTAAHPWRMNAHLEITARDGSRWQGTGWFLGPRVLITAGHCAFIRSDIPARHGWVNSITVIPGRNGTVRPYGSVVSTRFRSVTGWTQNGNQAADYAAIILPSPLGDQTGWYGFANLDDATLRATKANIAGYAGDKPYGTQWYHAGDVSNVDSDQVFYNTDTTGGQSGSAVYRFANGQRHAVAIHAYGGSSANSGARVNADRFTRLQAWKNLS